jgi:hypothetical protein
MIRKEKKENKNDKNDLLLQSSALPYHTTTSLLKRMNYCGRRKNENESRKRRCKIINNASDFYIVHT